MIMFKQIMLILLTLPLASYANGVFQQGQWRITYDDATKSIKVHYQQDNGSYRPVFTRSDPEAHYNYGGVERSVHSSDFAEVICTEHSVTDEIGSATRYDITFSKPANGDDVTLTQHFFLYGNKPYFVTSLELSSSQQIKSNYLAPVSCSSQYVLFTNNSSNNRILSVPFDNDGFQRYERRPLTQSTTSYEVTAIYEGEQRDGFVIGSIDHDHWKSAINGDFSDNGKIKQLTVFSGVANSQTHDTMPHGSLVGDTIRSARFLTGYFADWRDGMETFAEVCNDVQPKLNTWHYGRPVGWMTWNVLADGNNFTDDLESMQFIHSKLVPAGFTNGKGPDIISIDAWSNLSTKDERDLIAAADTMNMLLGCYATPFSYGGDSTSLDNTYYKSSLSQYKVRDVILYDDKGKPLTIDGAFCLDPTHPAVKAANAAYIREKYNLGYRYFKLDFITNGIVEAASYYNKNVHTGVEAYNEGMAYFLKQVQKQSEPVYIDLSISPLFPYQYANARRQSCDTWGSINWTEYSVNALTAGWWTNRLYQYNDPDGLPMIGNGDQKFNTMAENRSRITNGLISGQVLMADNFSQMDKSGKGNAEKSRTRAMSLLTNPDINALLALDPDFRPVYGYKEFEGSSNLAEPFLYSKTDNAYYLVIFNYTFERNADNMKGSISLDDLGISANDFSEVKELWSGDVVTTDGKTINYDIPSRDCRIYRFSRNTSTGIRTIDNNDEIGKAIDGDIAKIEIYDMMGRMISTILPQGTENSISLPNISGVFVAKITFKNGTSKVRKIILK